MEQKEMTLLIEEYRLFSDGDERGFRYVFDRYHQVLFRYAYAVSKCDFESEEVVQEAFITLFSSKASIKEHGQIYPFLFLVLKRLLIMRFRKKVVQSKYQAYIKGEWNEGSTDTLMRLDEKDLLDALQVAMESLPTKERESYRLNKLIGLSYEEIALSTGVSRHTIKNQIISASKKVKFILGKYYFVTLFLFFA